MLIFAGEDVGLADPRALQVAQAAAAGFEYVGLPEGQFLLAACCLYLATAPKSNSTMAYFDALAYVEKEQAEDIPDPPKDASRDRKGFGHGEGYKYPHAYRDHYVPQQYLPDSMQGTYFYEPGEQGYERYVKERLAAWRARDEEERLEKRLRRYAGGGTPPASE
jgi:putative ATPase